MLKGMQLQKQSLAGTHILPLKENLETKVNAFQLISFITWNLFFCIVNVYYYLLICKY